MTELEDIKAALKLLEDKGIYDPNDGKFKISRELYNYIMEGYRFRWGSPKGLSNLSSTKDKDKTTLNTED